MAVSRIRRRLKMLEETGLFSAPRVCRPLVPDDIEILIKKLRQGTRLDLAEVASLEQQTPVIHGEYLIAAHNGRVIAKRYIGIDVAAEI
jgi:hypothetical protein